MVRFVNILLPISPLKELQVAREDACHLSNPRLNH